MVASGFDRTAPHRDGERQLTTGQVIAMKNRTTQPQVRE
jgi:hypothetical protein